MKKLLKVLNKTRTRLNLDQIDMRKKKKREEENTLKYECLGERIVTSYSYNYEAREQLQLIVRTTTTTAQEKKGKEKAGKLHWICSLKEWEVSMLLMFGRNL